MPGLNKPNKIIVHHTGGTDANSLADTSTHTATTIDSWHKTRWPGFTSQVFRNRDDEFYHVGYHFVIEKDGKIVQTRDITEEGAHCIGQNKSSIGIVLSGNFDLSLPTNEQKKAFRRLFNELKAKVPGLTEYDIFPHRKYANKTCYGLRLSDTYFTDFLKPKQDEAVVKALQHQVVQLATSLIGLLTSKRYSRHETNN